jgi:hypothetical protein
MCTPNHWNLTSDHLHTLKFERSMQCTRETAGHEVLHLNTCEMYNQNIWADNVGFEHLTGVHLKYLGRHYWIRTLQRCTIKTFGQTLLDSNTCKMYN